MKIIENIQKGLYNFVMGGKPMEEQTKVINSKEYNEQLENQVWYDGNSDALKNFYSQFGISGINSQRHSSLVSTKANYFWGKSASTENIKKMHSGLPAMMVDKLVQLTLGDDYILNAETESEMKPVKGLDGKTIKDENGNVKKSDEVTTEILEEILEENHFQHLGKQATTDTLVIGDGAFKIDVDTDISDYPVIEWVDGKFVEYMYVRNKLIMVRFKSFYEKKNQHYCLYENRFLNDKDESTIQYELYEIEKDRTIKKQVPLDTLEETAGLGGKDGSGIITFTTIHEILAIPFFIWKEKDRGKSIFKRKKDMFDAIDETISINSDAVRDSRTERYIPEDMLDVNINTGMVIMPDGFDSRYIATKSTGKENANDKIQIVQPDIKFDGYDGTLKGFIYQALLGILSPSTLGLDMAGKDNAEAQREREKTSIFTRTDIVRAIETTFAELFELVLQVNDVLNNKQPQEYDVNLTFGEYASLSFEDKINAMAKAKQFKVLPNSQVIEELYGNSKSEDEKNIIIQSLNDADTPIDMNTLFPTG